MPEALQDLSWFLAKIIYGLIPDVYAIFEFFAKQEFFTRGELANLWNNLYVVMSVLVLFAIGIKLISAIVNPDALDGKDSPKKKNAKRSFFDAIIAVFLIILIPMGFSLLTSLQTEIIESKFIQKYIFGITFTAESQSSVGQLLAYQTLSAFLYPCTDTDGTCNPQDGQNAMNALSWDIKKMGDYIKSEDLKSDGINDGSIHKNNVVYHPVLGLVAGGLVLYQVVIMALDMALRSAKLALLELMLPIILGAFIFDREILTKWVKEFISTYLGAFLKLMAVTMMVLGLSRINIFFESFENSMNGEVVDNNIAKGLLRLILMMGILRLVKEVPNIINKIFGTNIQYQGGIKGRLGQMAGVGGIAQRAWDTLTHHPLQTARRTIAAPLSAVGGAVSHGAAAFGKARGQWRAGNQGAAIRTGIGGFFGLGGAAVRAGQQGWRSGNLQGIGAQHRRYEDTHLNDSTLGGRALDTLGTSLGFGTREERQAERDKLIQHVDPITGTRRRMTFEELQARQSVNKGFDDVRAAIRSQVETSIDRESSNVNIGMGGAVSFTSAVGGAHGTGFSATLQGNAASIRKQLEAISTASVDELRTAYGIDNADEKAQLIAGLNQAYAAARNNILDASENAVWANGVGAQVNGQNVLATGADIAIVNNNLDHVTDLINDNADLSTLITTGHADPLTGVVTTSAITTGPGGQVRISDFRAGGRLTVTDEYNAINRDVNRHNDEIAARQSTDRGREQHASGQSVNAARNNNANGGNGGGHH